MRVIKTDGSVIECSVDEYKLITEVAKKPLEKIHKPVNEPIEQHKSVSRATHNGERKHQQWSGKEKKILRQMFKEGKNDSVIAKTLGRTKDSIGMERFKLGLITKFRTRNKKQSRKPHKHNKSNDMMLSFMGKRTAQLIKTGLTRKDASRQSSDEWKLIKAVRKAETGSDKYEN